MTTIASTIAILAALITLYYARATVREGRQARREASEANEEQLRHETRLLAETKAAHAHEVEARERSMERELWQQRLAQLGRVQELLGRAADTARDEIAEPPMPIEGQPGLWTRLPGVLTQAEAALVTLEQLGGPELSKIRRATVDLRHMRTPPAQVAGETMSALATTIHLAENDPSFRPPRQGRPRAARRLCGAHSTYPRGGNGSLP